MSATPTETIAEFAGYMDMSRRLDLVSTPDWHGKNVRSSECFGRVERRAVGTRDLLDCGRMNNGQEQYVRRSESQEAKRCGNSYADAN